MRLVRGIAAFGLFVFVADAALAASQSDLDSCKKATSDVAIAACTRVIQDRNENVKNRFLAYFSRGWQYRYRRDLDRAIADYTEAIRLDPKSDLARLYRGVTYNFKGEYDRAIADFTESIRLEPKQVYAYFNRGVAYNAKGDRARAIAEFRKAAELGNRESREELRKLGVTP